MNDDPPNWERPHRVDMPWTVVCTECSACGASVANWERHEEWHFNRAVTETARNAATMLTVPERQRTPEMRREIEWAQRFARSLAADGV